MKDIPKKNLFDFDTTYLYKFRFDDNNDLYLDLYMEKVKTKIIDGKKRSYNERQLLNRIFHPNVKEYIPELKKKGYISYIKKENEKYDIHTLTPIGGFIRVFLKNNCELLQKVYDEVIIDNMLYVVPYYVYINVNTGEIGYVKQSFNLKWSESLVENLIASGYKHIGNSYLSDITEKISTTRILPKKI